MWNVDSFRDHSEAIFKVCTVVNVDDRHVVGGLRSHHAGTQQTEGKKNTKNTQA